MEDQEEDRKREPQPDDAPEQVKPGAESSQAGVEPEAEKARDQSRQEGAQAESVADEETPAEGLQEDEDSEFDEETEEEELMATGQKKGKKRKKRQKEAAGAAQEAEEAKEVEGEVVEGALCKDTFAAAGKEIGEALSEGLGKVVGGVAAGVKFASSKLGGLSGSAKLRVRNVLLNKTLRRLFGELGEVVFDLHGEGEIDLAQDKEVKAILRKIADCREEIGSNNKSIAAAMAPDDENDGKKGKSKE